MGKYDHSQYLAFTSLFPHPTFPTPAPAAFLALASGFSQRDCPFGLFHAVCILPIASNASQVTSRSSQYSLGIFAFFFQSDYSLLHPQMFSFLPAHLILPSLISDHSCSKVQCDKVILYPKLMTQWFLKFE